MKNLIEFNESSKFFEIKSLIDNLKDMLVELNDAGIVYQIEPSNEIRIKFIALGKDGYFHLALKDLASKNELYDIIIENIKMLVDYMDGNGFDTTFTAKYSMNKDTYSGEVTLDRLIKEFKSNKQPVYWVQLDFIMQDKPVLECLPNEKSIKQLEMVAKLSKKTDIGNRISDMNKEGANIHWIQNPIETGIESREDYEKNGRKQVKHFKEFNESFKDSQEIEDELNKICEYELLDILDKGFCYYVNTDESIDDSEVEPVILNIYYEDEVGDNAVFDFEEIKDDFLTFIEYLNERYEIMYIRFNHKTYSYDSLFNDDFNERFIEHLDIFIKR
jgi:hypothetical protein